MKKERKTRHIDIRLTEKDFAILKQQADGNLSAFCRKLLLQNAVPQKEERDLKELVYQIRKIGININQVTARMNAGISFLDDGEVLKNELQKVYRLLKELEE